MNDLKWAGSDVFLYEGPAEHDRLDLNDDAFPWLCVDSDGIDVVVTDWTIRDGELDCDQIGINLSVLVDDLIEKEPGKHKIEAEEDRINAIKALESIIVRLKTKPIIFYKPS